MGRLGWSGDQPNLLLHQLYWRTSTFMKLLIFLLKNHFFLDFIVNNHYSAISCQLVFELFSLCVSLSVSLSLSSVFSSLCVCCVCVCVCVPQRRSLFNCPQRGGVFNCSQRHSLFNCSQRNSLFNCPCALGSSETAKSRLLWTEWQAYLLSSSWKAPSPQNRYGRPLIGHKKE